MGATTLMTIGSQAMFAAYAQLQTTANNIANANTPGYSRQTVRLATAEGQFTGSGYFGRGVSVVAVERASNMFLTGRAIAAQSVAAADQTRSDMLKQLQGTFGSAEAGLGYAATQLYNSFADLAAAPSDPSARQIVLARVEDFSALARSNADQLATLQTNVTQDVMNSTDEVNSLAKQVGALNARIVAATGTGAPPNDLLDQRDLLISKIAQKMEVSTLDAGDGSLSVFTAGGQTLVLGSNANRVLATTDPYDPSRIAVSLAVNGKTTPLDSKALGDGSIAGLMRFQNQDLVDMQTRLGQLVSAAALTMNQQQSLGLDLKGANGGPLFAVGPPQAMGASTNTGSGAITLAVTDPTALQASEYILDNDPANPGTYRVTRQSDGMVTSGVNSGDVVDGFSINVSGTLGGNDSFLLQPVSNAAAKVARVLADPSGIAAANPLTGAAAASNAGTATLGPLVATAPPASPYGAMTLQFTTNTSDWVLQDSGGSTLASGTWQPGTPISYDGFQLSLSGRPVAGDSFSITPTTNPKTNNGNAKAMDDMASKLLVGGGQSVSDAYARMLSDVGVRVQGAAAAAQTSSTVYKQAQDDLQGETGVNLDEEAARLIQFQQAYQAAAKMLQSSQQVLQTLIEMGQQ